MEIASGEEQERPRNDGRKFIGDNYVRNLTCTSSNPTKTWMPRLSFAPKDTAPRGDTLVVVFLRGAADVLNMVVPHGEDAYYQLRPTLGIATTR